jgi:hypothetical protein
MNSGFEANHSGKWLEDICERGFLGRGFFVRDYSDDAIGTEDMFNPRVLLRRVPYISVAGYEGTSEFVAYDYPSHRSIRIECKWQDGPGSADERLYYTWTNACEAYSETEVLILVGGEGMRKGIVNDIRKRFNNTHNLRKKGHLLNVNEFHLWLKMEFVR